MSATEPPTPLYPARFVAKAPVIFSWGFFHAVSARPAGGRAKSPSNFGIGAEPGHHEHRKPQYQRPRPTRMGVGAEIAGKLRLRGRACGTQHHVSHGLEIDVAQNGILSRFRQFGVSTCGLPIVIRSFYYFVLHLPDPNESSLSEKIVNEWGAAMRGLGRVMG